MQVNPTRGLREAGSQMPAVVWQQPQRLLVLSCLWGDLLYLLYSPPRGNKLFILILSPPANTTVLIL